MHVFVNLYFKKYLIKRYYSRSCQKLNSRWVMLVCKHLKFSQVLSR